MSGSQRRAGARTTRQLVSEGAGVLRPQSHGDVNPGAEASVPPLVIGFGAGGTRNRAVLADAVAGPGNALTVPPPSADHPAEAVARAVPVAIPRAATPSSARPAAARSAPCPRSPG
ncbi:hypothetical protein [Streptomyces sp. HGB0020]|uniref:hypothetical protein n=1 Tax=Streptomyces sp. HGB0020 TaxID=1078086 RepID=UPI00056D7B49|nr:hypothetical protein [Streptomyces sp. HGB0020]